MKEFEDFNSIGQTPIKKTNKTWLICSILLIPFYLRLIFYNVVYDLPLGWMLFSVITIGLIVVFAKKTYDGYQLVWYGQTGIQVKYLMVFILPIMVTAFFEDLKLSQSAVIHNSNYTNSLAQGSFKDQEESVELVYNTLSVVNKIGGQMIYVVQLPFLGLFNKIEVVKIYQTCLIKKIEGQFSEKTKEQVYDRLFQMYWEEGRHNKRFTGIGQAIQQSYSFRIARTIEHSFAKVFLFRPFDSCR